MENSNILRVRFPFEDDNHDVLARIQKFESFFYNIFHLLLKNSEAISLEIVQIQGMMNFYIVTPAVLTEAIQSFLYSMFPDASVDQLSQYDQVDQLPAQAVGFRVQLKGSEAFSLRSAKDMHTDPLNAFFNVLGDTPTTDGVFYQLIIRAIDESLSSEESGGSGMYGFNEKAHTEVAKPKFNATIRILYFPKDASDMKHKTASYENVFTPLSTEHNYLQIDTATDIQTFSAEYFDHTEASMGVLDTEEISSLFHSPDPDAKIRGINWLYSRRAEPPMNLPSFKNTDKREISVFGETNFRGQHVEFGIKREDRRRHLYVVGKSGSGKSKLLEKLIIDDVKAGKGVGVIDPHGDLVQAVLHEIPPERYEDVVYFSPSDLDFPIAFNPVANVEREFKQQITQGLIEIFEKFFGADWSPKIEHVFRFTILALLDYPKATMMGMQKMLTDREYRQKVINEIQDHVVKKFWANEFSGWSEKFDNEAIVPLVNKIGQFLSNEMVRNIVSQSKNKVDFDDIMNNEKILLVELSKGKLGEENSSLLGSLLITKIEQTGMKRAFLEQSKRKDFYLYVDEFQNFATQTFDNILSEARKYRLDLTISHQYLGQLLPSTKQTVFGNVGSIITLRMGADDAEYISKEFAPRFTGYDIMNLGVREMYLKMSIDGQVTPAFSARTVSVADPDFASGHKEKAIAASRRKYATPIAEVEAELKGEAKAEEKQEVEFEEPLL